MIQYIKRENIDVAKYDVCIENSIQSRIYAYSWYLDIVADNWGVLVLNDYEAVMPIPWRVKYFIKYVSQPDFCQQLGVFSKKEISEILQKKMTQEIPNKFLKVILNFNSANFSTPKMKLRKNYVLELNTDYSRILKSFSKGRKHAVKKSEKNHLYIKNTTIIELIKMKREFYKHETFSSEIIERLSYYLLSNKKGFILGVYKEEALLGGGLFLKSNNRITYLFSSFNSEGRKLQAASFLINNIIKRYVNSNFVLDFEGGNLPNIGSFFKSFGSKNEMYYQLENNSLLNLLRLKK
ncbi:MAG: hypothetical protein V3V28_11890 [Polaribacter sp.]|uniref:hypothetical protein n=1 Tax=Polaribacter sp. TaxID=1920175 RepID=UPI002F350645